MRILETGSLVVVLIFLALFVEWFCERFFGKKFQGDWMIYLSAAIGILVCVLFRLDALQLLNVPPPIGAPYTGQVITGLIVGAGSNVVHKFFGKYLPASSDTVIRE